MSLKHLPIIVICFCLSLPYLQSSVFAFLRKSCTSHHKSKGCELLNNFLQDVLKAQNDLSWIDQMADIFRSKNTFSSNPVLQQKLNVMFFSAKNQNKMKKRRKRHQSKFQLENTIDNKHHNFSNPKYENVGPQYFNPREILTTTTMEPFEKLLQSINVFPVELSHSIAKEKSNDDTAESHDDSFEKKAIGRALKSISVDDESKDNHFAKLLLVEDEGDKSQINRALHGDLAKEIVNEIFDQIKSTEAIHRMTDIAYRYNVKSQDSFVIDNIYRPHQAFGTNGETSEISKKVLTAVQQLISEEVEKRSCRTLVPDMQNFLQWLLLSERQVVDGKNSQLLPERQEPSMTNNNPSDSFSSISDLNEWYTKAETLKSLLNEYEGLSKREKNKVRAIHEYLVTRLEFVQAYIESFKPHSLNLDKIINIPSN